MKNEDVIRVALFSLALLLVVALLYVVTSPIQISDSGRGEINKLKTQMSLLEEKMETLRSDYNEKSNLYSQCQDELAKCSATGTAGVSECTNKGLNFNAICKKLGLGTLLRVNADRKNDIVFQCITETETTHLFYSRPSNETIRILDVTYNEVLTIVDCKI